MNAFCLLARPDYNRWLHSQIQEVLGEDFNTSKEFREIGRNGRGWYR